MGFVRTKREREKLAATFGERIKAEAVPVSVAESLSL